MLKKYLVAILILFGVLACSSSVQAGFGISPPYVKTSKPVFAGSHFEQKITLLRSSADEDLQAEIVVNAPEIESWITIDKGFLFDLPKNKLQIPMIVQVDVPEDAEIGGYKGYINVKIKPKEGRGSGVAIALGARVDIDIKVTDEPMIDFFVRKVDIPVIEKLGKPWEWRMFSWFFYRIKVVMRIENTGNVKIAPTKVKLEVYDLAEIELLETFEDTRIAKVEPFTTANVEATYPTNLDVGQYWGKISIYKDQEIIYKNKVIIDIKKKGELEGGTELGIWPWILLSIYSLIVIIIIIILIKIKIWRYIFKILYIISWPFIFIGKKIKEILNKIKVKFLKWLHSKTAESLNNNTQENKSPFAKATEDRPPFAKATEDRPPFAKATEDRPPFAKATEDEEEKEE